MIYAIRAVGTEYIKFGLATSVGKRLNELETACPHELEILAVADWPNGAERAIHLVLAGVRHKREWFLDGDLAQSVISWMLNKDLGLARLQHQVKGSMDWTDPIPRPRIKSVPLSPAARRRKQREEWWRQNGARLAQ